MLKSSFCLFLGTFVWSLSFPWGKPMSLIGTDVFNFHFVDEKTEIQGCQVTMPLRLETSASFLCFFCLCHLQPITTFCQFSPCNVTCICCFLSTSTVPFGAFITPPWSVTLVSYIAFQMWVLPPPWCLPWVSESWEYESTFVLFIW